MAKFQKYDIVIIMSTSWSGRHEGKHTEYIGLPGYVDRPSMDGHWFYILVMPDDKLPDIALYHETNIEHAGANDVDARGRNRPVKGAKLKVDKAVASEIWENYGRQSNDPS